MYEEQSTIVPSLYFEDHINDVKTRVVDIWKRLIEKISNTIFI